jgi:ligand-binding sensor domain-containing protein
MNQLLAFLFCLLSVTKGLAQEPRIIQHEIGEANAGISMYTLIQDHQCMIWVGTATGLAQYDGNTLRSVPLTTSDTVYQVTSLFEDKDHRIWIGTSSGTIFYLDPSRKVHYFTIEESHPVKSITGIVQDSSGYIWFSTYGEGAYVYTGKRLFSIDTDDKLNSKDIYAMICTPNGEVWLGTDDGINICRFEQEKKYVRSLELKDGLPDQIITALESDQNGNVWIGTFEFGIVYYDATTQKISRPFKQMEMDAITSFTIFDGEEIWIGTQNSGVWRYNREYSFPMRMENLRMFKHGRVTDLLADIEGNIWIVMEEGKLFSAFRPFETLEVNMPDIQSLMCDYQDRLWIGTKKGLYRSEQQSWAHTKTIRVIPAIDFNIKDLVEDRFHNIWIGTLDHGLYVYDPSGGDVKHIGSILKQEGSTIMSMAVSEKEIWMATLEGVVLYPADKNIMLENHFTFQVLGDDLNSKLPFVNQIFIDSKGTPWFAMNGNGVYSLEDNSLVEHKGTNKLQIKTVYAVCEDNRNHLWFNTPDHGLIEFNGTQYTSLGLKEGLDNMNIASIIITGKGDMVITHNRGIDIMETERRHFMYYNDEIGIQEIEAGFNVVARDSKGHVYSSARNMIIKYFSTQLPLSIDPRTQLTRVSVFDKAIDFSTQQYFPYSQNYFTFDYVGLWYISPSSVKYSYKLENYDRQWKESKDNMASYSNLPPGSYTFKVMASENNFFLNEPTDSYSFTIGKPFWRRYWFIGLMVVCITGALYWLVKTREKRSGRQAIIKRDMIESQLSALKAQINPHFLFNSFNTLITIIDENSMNPEVAIEYVEKLSDFYRSILQYREQESISLEEEWELVQNFVYLLEKRYGTNLRLYMDAPPKDAYILPLTLQMLVENAVKHNVISEKYPLDLYITIEGGDCVVVKNSMQPKSKAEPSTQFGLQSIIKRYQLLSDQKVIVESNSDYFKVCIPIIKKSDP